MTAKCDSPEVEPDSMAATLSLDEAERALWYERALAHDYGAIAGGVGCFGVLIGLPPSGHSDGWGEGWGGVSGSL